MEQYIVSARKYRPATFRSVIGQDSLTTTLKNAIKTQHLAHAYLFCGPRGVGKTTCARIFAKTINCSNLSESGEACNECESCVSFNEQRSLNIFEMDAASNNSVDDIRELVKQVMVPPQIGKYRVYIIDEVHMLSTPAFNAFLKTLEEPPEYAIFILATTEKHKILPTIISRCQVYDFNRIQVGDTVSYLKYVAESEHIVAESEALEVIAQKADGAMRDALSIFDQIVSYCGKEIKYKEVIEILNVLDYEYYLKIVDGFLQGDVIGSLLILDNVINKGFDLQSFVSGLSSHIRDLLVAQNEGSLKLLLVSDGVKQRYGIQAKRCPPIFLFQALELAVQCELNYKVSKNKRLLVELMLIKICQLIENPEKKNDNEVVIKKIEPQNTVGQLSEPTEIPTVTTMDGKVSEQPLPHRQPAQTEPQNTPKYAGNVLNLSSILNKSEKKETLSATPMAADNAINKLSSDGDFTEEELQECWTEYGKSIEGRPFYSKYVTEIKPKKDGTNSLITVISEQQFKEFTDNRADIESFLSQRLGTDVKLIIDKCEVERSKNVSPDEMLRNMVGRNNNLQELINQLRLDISY